MSISYEYVKGQVILGNFSKNDLLILVNRKIITEEERFKLERLV